MAQSTARFVTEMAPPPQVVSVVRRRKTVARSLDTIAEEDDMEQLAAYGSSSSEHGFAAAWSLKTPSPPQVQLAWERTGGFTRDLTCVKYLSDAHGCQPSGHRRAVHAQELYKVGA